MKGKVSSETAIGASRSIMVIQHGNMAWRESIHRRSSVSAGLLTTVSTTEYKTWETSNGHHVCIELRGA